MIDDTLNNSSLYCGLSPRIARAFDYLRGTDFQSAATGTFEIDGRQVYAIVQEYATLERTRGTGEAHRQYIDLQYVVAGTERIGYTHVRRLTPGSYDQERDLLPLSGAGDFLTKGGRQDRCFTGSGPGLTCWPAARPGQGLCEAER